MARDYEALYTQQQTLRAQVLPGLYRHYKGGIYCIEKVVFDQETENPRVNYHDERHPAITWSIPLESWSEEVEIEGHKIPRFTWLAKEAGTIVLDSEAER